MIFVFFNWMNKRHKASLLLISCRRLLQLPGYSTVIKAPMWLGQVANKLQVEEYHTVQDFVSDVQLIFTNCASYNRVSMKLHLVHLGLRLKKRVRCLCDSWAFSASWYDSTCGWTGGWHHLFWWCIRKQTTRSPRKRKKLFDADKILNEAL